MIANEDFLKFLAAWELVHETADEGLKAAISRGEAQDMREMESGPGAFVDGLAAVVNERKEVLKAQLAAGEDDDSGQGAVTQQDLEDIRFEIGELRGRIESMSTTLDAIARDLKPGGGRS